MAFHALPCRQLGHGLQHGVSNQVAAAGCVQQHLLPMGERAIGISLLCLGCTVTEQSH